MNRPKKSDHLFPQGDHRQNTRRHCAVVAMCILLAGLTLLPGVASAAPYHGEEVYTYRQPDGSKFGVRLYGDEYFAYQRTEDGHEVIQDPKTGFWCYAVLAADGRSFVSTGIPVVTAEKGSGSLNKSLAVSRGAAIPNQALPLDVILDRVQAAKERLGVLDWEADRAKAGGEKAVEGRKTGLCILVDFPPANPLDIPEGEVDDGQRVYTQAEVGRFCNQPTEYGEYGNACSVNEYFHIQSNGKLDYVNVVTEYIRMPYPKIFYDDGEESGKVGMLLATVQAKLLEQGINWGDYTYRNIYYAGKARGPWTKGLWPHSGGSYQMTDMGNPLHPEPSERRYLSIGTFCHENGHMVCGYPDLYSYISAGLGAPAGLVGSYCLMCGGGGGHPPNFSPLLKIQAGWADVIEVLPTDHIYALTQVDRNHFYKLVNPARAAEYFLIENRNDTGYEGPYGGSSWSSAPGKGLAIWHVLATGSNMYSSIQEYALDEDDTQRYGLPYLAFIVEATPDNTTFTPWYKNPAPSPDDLDTFSAVQGANPVHGLVIPPEEDPDTYPYWAALNANTLPELFFWDTIDGGLEEPLYCEGRTKPSGFVVHAFGSPGDSLSFIIGITGTSGSPADLAEVTGPRDMRVTATHISARCSYGQNPPNQTFYVFNAGGGGMIAFEVSSNAPWLGCTSETNLAPRTGRAITVSFDATGLAAGVHTGQITVTDHGSATYVLDVTLTIDERSDLNVSPLAFTEILNYDEVSSDQNLKVGNDGGGFMKYTATVATPGAPWQWLSTSVASGTVGEGLSDPVYLIMTPRNTNQSPPVLRKGTYTGSVTINAANALNTPQVATVQLTVNGYITVLSPNGGELWQPGVDTVVPIDWATNTEDSVHIQLWKWDSGAVDYVLDRDIATVAYDGDPDLNGRARYNWTLPGDIDPGARYQMRVFTGGATWGASEHRDQSDAEFNILRAAYYTNLAGNPAWTYAGVWAWGAPMGGGGSIGNPDPTRGYSGDFVVGYNLSGNYANSMPSTVYTTFGPVDCTRFVDTRLLFRRWLGVEASDTATIEIRSVGSTWHQVWRNPADADVLDGSGGQWTLAEYDISAFADRQPNVWIRFGMGPTDHVDRACGWNLDDIAVYGHYATGSLQVTITPQTAIDAGAQWRLEGGAWRNSGTTIPALETGTYTVQFKDVNGWTTPEEEVVEILDGQATTVTGVYTQFGTLRVILEPQGARNAGAQWRVDGGAWQNSGTTISGLVVGTHTVQFKNVTDWTTPPSQSVAVGLGQATVITAYYTQYGSLRVTIDPAAVRAAGAQWRVDGGLWRDSGTVADSLTAGSHTVQFKDVGGWTKPVNQTVEIVKNQQSEITRSYTQHTGLLTVLINPAEARAAGAQWRLDGGAWQDGGATISGVTVGSHTVSFKEISGWTTPPNQNVQMLAKEVVVVSESYTRQTGSLYVAIEPAGARTAGAQWRVDGGAWQDSGVTLNGVVPGAHLIEFKAVAGWTAPANQNAAITANQTTVATGTYTDQGGGGGGGGGGGTGDGCETAKSARLAPAGIREEAFPVARALAVPAIAAPGETLAVRLSAKEPIDEATVWMVVVGEGYNGVEGAWRPVDPSRNDDGWVTHTLGEEVPQGTALTVTAGALTVDGGEVGPVVSQFEIGAASEQAAPGVLIEEATDAEPLPETLAASCSNAYRVGPEGLFDAPATLLIPLPQSVAADSVEVYYLSEAASHPGWYAGDSVYGWLVPGSKAVVEQDGAVYLRVEVNHSGIVQAGIPADNRAAAGSGYAGAALMLSLMAAVLWAAGRRAKPRRVR